MQREFSENNPNEIDGHCSVDAWVVLSQLQCLNSHPIPTALYTLCASDWGIEAL